MTGFPVDQLEVVNVDNQTSSPTQRKYFRLWRKPVRPWARVGLFSFDGKCKKYLGASWRRRKYACADRVERPPVRARANTLQCSARLLSAWNFCWWEHVRQDNLRFVSSSFEKIDLFLQWIKRSSISDNPGLKTGLRVAVDSVVRYVSSVVSDEENSVESESDARKILDRRIPREGKVNFGGIRLWKIIIDCVLIRP